MSISSKHSDCKNLLYTLGEKYIWKLLSLFFLIAPYFFIYNFLKKTNWESIFFESVTAYQSLIFLTLFSLIMLLLFFFTLWFPSLILLADPNKKIKYRLKTVLISAIVSFVFFILLIVLASLTPDIVFTHFFLSMFTLAYLMFFILVNIWPSKEFILTSLLIIISAVSLISSTYILSSMITTIRNEPFDKISVFVTALIVFITALIIGYFPILILMLRSKVIQENNSPYKKHPYIIRNQSTIFVNISTPILILYLTTALFFIFPNNYQDKILIIFGIISEKKKDYLLLNKGLINAVDHVGLNKANPDIFEKELIFSAYTRFRLGEKHLLCITSLHEKNTEKDCIPFNKNDIQQLTP